MSKKKRRPASRRQREEVSMRRQHTAEAPKRATSVDRARELRDEIARDEILRERPAPAANPTSTQGTAGLFDLAPAVANPFPADDARHALWEQGVLITQHDLSKFQSEMDAVMPPEHPADEEQASRDLDEWGYNLITGTFDRFAWMVTRFGVTTGNLQRVEGTLNEIAGVLFERRPKSINTAELKRRLHGRFEHWMAEARRLLIVAKAQQDPSVVGVEPHGKLTQEEKERRAAVVMPILKAKGWSVFKWSEECNLDYHTIDGYLRTGTSPYPQTRKKMAESLGIAVEKLPE